MNIKSFHHVCIQTDKYKESLFFYTEILGFKVVKETPNFHTRDYNTWLELKGIMIELQTPKSDTTLNKWSNMNGGPVHLGFVVEDVKKAYDSIIAKGYSDFKDKNGEHVYFVENGWLFKIKAPEGTEIEIRDNEEL